MSNRFHWDESDVVITRASSVEKHYGGGHNQKAHGNRGGRTLGLVMQSKAKPGEFKGSQRVPSKMRLVGEDGSYYDYIDFDDPDYHPVQQLLDMATEHLPLTDVGEITLDQDFGSGIGSILTLTYETEIADHPARVSIEVSGVESW